MDGISRRVWSGRFTLLPQERQLLVDGEPAKLGACAFAVLSALAERRDRVLSKDELLDLAWPGAALEAKQYVDPVTFVAIHGALGEMDVALGWYEKAFVDRTPNMAWAAILPGMNPELVGSARFQVTLDRMGLSKPAR